MDLLKALALSLSLSFKHQQQQQREEEEEEEDKEGGGGGEVVGSRNDGRVPRGVLRASGECGAVPLPLRVHMGETICALGVGKVSVARTRAGRWRMGRAADGTGETNETTTGERRGKRGRGEGEDKVNDARKNAKEEEEEEERVFLYYNERRENRTATGLDVSFERDAKRKMSRAAI